MAQHTFIENVHRNTEDWFAVKAAVRGKGVDCPDDTPTANVAGKIGQIETGEETITQNFAQYAADPPNGASCRFSWGIAEDVEFIITFPNPQYEDESAVFDYDNVMQNLVTEVVIPDGYTSVSSFEYLNRLKRVQLPDTIGDVFGDGFMYCSALENIKIPSAMTTLKNRMFGSCTALKSIIIPNTITSIGYHCFNGCDALTDVYFTGSQTDWNNITIDPDGNTALLNATIHYNYVPE